MSPQQENKTQVISELLKSADRAIKDGRLDDAFSAITKVFDIDPKNVYARAYKERILYLKKESDEKKKAEGERPKAEEKKKLAAPVVKEVKPPAPMKEVAKPQPSSAQRSAATLEAYRTLLTEIWADGAIESEENTRVDSMRETFAIPPSEHSAIEREVRIQSFLSAIRQAWESGLTSFDDVRKRFKITNEEYLTIEPIVIQLLQSLKSRGTVMLLDDDPAFLEVVKSVLEDAGYYTFTAASGEEGLKLLETVTPDIVVCDINFGKPNMSGFTFYERFRSFDRFTAVPFIFVSAFDQDIIIRTGKQLGADDYLAKPFDPEMFIATIEGKIKRYRELRRSSSSRT